MYRLLILVSLGLSLGCKTSNSVEPPAGSTGTVSAEDAGATGLSVDAVPLQAGEIEVAALREIMSEDLVLIDVRTPGEFADGRAVGTVNIPLGDLEERMDELAPHKADTIYLICRSGNRSGTAAKLLAAQGYHSVNVLGGTLAWTAAGYPIEQ